MVEASYPEGQLSPRQSQNMRFAGQSVLTQNLHDHWYKSRSKTLDKEFGNVKLYARKRCPGVTEIQ